jgi:phospholipid transport system substrate-binding protein
MRIKILFSPFFILFFGCVMSLAPYVKAANQSDPVALLQYIANNMIEHLKEHKATLKTKPQVVYALARQYVVPYADLSEMSKQVLSPAIWNNASAMQRKRFQQEFTTLLIRTCFCVDFI